MSQRLRNSYDLEGNNVIPGYATFQRLSADPDCDIGYSSFGNNSVHRLYEVISESPAKKPVNIGTFCEENYQGRAMYNSSRNFDPDLYVKALSANIGSHNANPNSTALQALQDYGPTGSSLLDNNWNAGYHHTARKHDVESSNKMTDFAAGMHSSETLTQKQVPELHSVDDEDAYLYGDSSSLPEEPKSVKPQVLEENVHSTNSGWSDEDEIICESSKSILSNVKFSSPKKPSVWDVPNENKEPLRTLQSKFSEEEHSSSARKNITLDKLQNILSPAQNVFTGQVEKAKLSDLGFEKNVSPNNQSSETKSKYHMAAQILKRKSYEKSNNVSKVPSISGMSHNINHSSAPNLELETSRRVTLIEENVKISSKRNVSKDFKKLSQTGKVELQSSKTPGSSKDRRYTSRALHPRNLESIREYLKGSPRKRSHTQAELSYESKCATHESFRDISPMSPFESRRSRSPDSSHRSPYSSRYRSPTNKARCRSPIYGSRNRSPVTMYDRYSYENSPRNYSYDRYSRYSRSPVRKSQDRSPEYFRYRNRSPRSSRSAERSKSPSYHSSRDKRSEHKKESYKGKITSHKHQVRSPERHPQRKGKKARGSSNDSFCSVSVSRSVSPKSESDENLRGAGKKDKGVKKCKDDEKMLKHDKLKKCIGDFKSSGAIPSKTEDSCQNTSEKLSTEDKHSEKDINALREDLLKNLNPEDEKYLHFFKMVEENPDVFQEILSDAPNQQLLPGNSSVAFTDPVTSYANITNTYNSIIPPLTERTPLSHPEPYSYNSSIPPIPVPFPPPPADSFTPLMPSAVFPPPPAVSSVDYNSYINSTIPSVDTRVVDVKPKFQTRQTRPPVTLRPIPVSDDVPSASNVSGQQISVRCHQLGALDVDSLPESKKNKLTAKLSPKKNLIEVSTNSAESSSGDSISLLLGKYKKLKVKRHSAQTKVNTSVIHIKEMNKKMEELWGKKNINPDEKFFHSKCKNIINSCLDGMRYYVKEAKQFDDELNKFKSKLPKELLPEITKIKVENLNKESEAQSVIYEGTDEGKSHMCYTCNKQFQTTCGMLDHLHTSAHKEHAEPSENDWMKKICKKEPKQESMAKEEPKKIVQMPIRGVEFMKPFSGYYCTLCEETLPNAKFAESHLFGHDHAVKYKNYIKDNPLYEKLCLFRTYINYSASARDKRKRDDERKEQQSAKRKKVEEAEGKVKEMLVEQKSKETKIEELEEMNMEASGSKNQMTTNIKLNLSGDKEKKLSGDKEKEQEKQVSENKNKTGTKVVYIGKAPNFKNRSKPWYKREMYAEKNESIEETNLSTDALKISVNKDKDIDSKSKSSLSKDVSQTSKNAVSSNPDTYKAETNSSEKGVVPTTSLTNEKCNISSKDNSVTKLSETVEETSSKSSHRDNSASESKKQSKQHKGSKISSKEHSVPEVKDPVVNQAIKNILYGNESSLRQKDIQISEIKLPDNPSNSSKCRSQEKERSNDKKESKDKAVPMDLSPVSSGKISVFDPNRKSYTEEENDFIILGINKEDFRPLAVPVPPPSVMGYYNVPANSTINTAVPPPTAIDTSVPPPNITANQIDTSVPPPILNINTSVPPPVLPLNTIDISVPPPIAINTNVPPPTFPLNVNQSANYQLPSHTGFTSPQNFPRPVVGKKSNLSIPLRRVSADKSNLITIKTSEKPLVSSVLIKNVSSANVRTDTNLSKKESKILTEEVTKVAEKSTDFEKGSEIPFTESSVSTKSTDTNKSLENEILKCEQSTSNKNTEKDIAAVKSSNIQMKLSVKENKGSIDIEVIDISDDDTKSCSQDTKSFVEKECKKEDINVGIEVNKTTDIANESIVNEAKNQCAENCISDLKIYKSDSPELKSSEITFKVLESANKEVQGTLNMHGTENTVSGEAVSSSACLNEPTMQNEKTSDYQKHNAADNILVDKTVICEQNALVNNQNNNTETETGQFELNKDIISEPDSGLTECVKEIPCEKDSELKSSSGDQSDCCLNSDCETQYALKGDRKNYLNDESLPEMLEKTEMLQSTVVNSKGSEKTCKPTDRVLCSDITVPDQYLKNESGESLRKFGHSSNNNDDDLKAELGIPGVKTEAESEISSELPSVNTIDELGSSKNCSDDQPVPDTIMEKTRETINDQLTSVISRINEEASKSQSCAAPNTALCSGTLVSKLHPEEFSNSSHKFDHPSSGNSSAVLSTQLEMSGMNSNLESEKDKELPSEDFRFSNTSVCKSELEKESKNYCETQSISHHMEKAEKAVNNQLIDTEATSSWKKVQRAVSDELVGTEISSSLEKVQNTIGDLEKVENTISDLKEVEKTVSEEHVNTVTSSSLEKIETAVIDEPMDPVTSLKKVETAIIDEPMDTVTFSSLKKVEKTVNDEPVDSVTSSSLEKVETAIIDEPVDTVAFSSLEKVETAIIDEPMETVTFSSLEKVEKTVNDEPVDSVTSSSLEKVEEAGSHEPGDTVTFSSFEKVEKAVSDKPMDTVTSSSMEKVEKAISDLEKVEKAISDLEEVEKAISNQSINTGVLTNVEKAEKSVSSQPMDTEAFSSMKKVEDTIGSKPVDAVISSGLEKVQNAVGNQPIGTMASSHLKKSEKITNNQPKVTVISPNLEKVEQAISDLEKVEKAISDLEKVEKAISDLPLYTKASSSLKCSEVSRETDKSIDCTVVCIEKMDIDIPCEQKTVLSSMNVMSQKTKNSDSRAEPITSRRLRSRDRGSTKPDKFDTSLKHESKAESVDEKNVSKKTKKPVLQETEESNVIKTSPKCRSSSGRKLRSREIEDSTLNNVKTGSQEIEDSTSMKTESQGSVTSAVKRVRRSTRIRKSVTHPETSETCQKASGEITESEESQDNATKNIESVSVTSEELENDDSIKSTEIPQKPKNATFVTIEDSDTDEYENEGKK